jgi:hypothetical protein
MNEETLPGKPTTDGKDDEATLAVQDGSTVMGYTPKHAKPASREDAALGHGLAAIDSLVSIGRHAAAASTAPLLASCGNVL